jgi:hypothetical protein
MDSYELTEWLAYFEAKKVRDEQAAAEEESRNRLQRYVDGG